MSYYCDIQDFTHWLSRAQKALVSKNKIRKDLWTDFSDIILFEQPEEKSVTIPKSCFTTLQSFLLTEGRADSLSADSMLSWINTLHDLRSLINEETRSRAPSSAHETQRYHFTFSYDISTIHPQFKYLEIVLSPKSLGPMLLLDFKNLDQ